MKKQYIIKENDQKKREEFYDYIKANYKLKNNYPFERDRFIESNFPFVVDFCDNTFWICESITCLAAASTMHLIITIDEFMGETCQDLKLKKALK